jgi:hypothetical protein
VRPILVAVEAEAQRMANKVPATNQRKFLLIDDIRTSEDITSFFDDNLART